MTERDVERYLDRIGLDSGVVGAVEHSGDTDGADLEALARLQSAHVHSIPFETLSITGDPHGAYAGDPIELTDTALYEKLVERERGGFCYECNGAFAWLLEALGFDVRRCAARMASDDGGYGIPADHLTPLVTLSGGRQYLVDVGMGTPGIRRPVPLDGTVVENEVGVEWRVVEPDRPDAAIRLEYRERDGADWSDRFICDDRPRELSYFAAARDYHSTSPDSPFTGEPIAALLTPGGHVSLSPRTLTRTVRGERREREIDPSEYHDLLATEFGIRLD